MTLINWISIGICVITLIVGIVLRIYYKKKLNDLDGLHGIVKDEEVEKELD